MDKTTAEISIFFHNYYGEHEKWLQFFSEKKMLPYHLFYSIVEDSIYNLEYDHHTLSGLEENTRNPHRKQLFFRKSSNKGKDIGGKMILLDAFMRLKPGSEYFVFLHDKKSPYKIQSGEWKNKLFRIIEPGFAQKAISSFKDDSRIGIIASRGTVFNEYDHAKNEFISKNKTQLGELKSRLGLSNTDYRFVAGTMFWVRAKPLLSFFETWPPLEIRKSLEDGNVMDDTGGSVTHAWERILSWIVSAQGYSIKELE